MSLVAYRDVRKSFGPTEVLKGVSVDVAKGDVVAIIGRSGSGKSTLLRCVNGLETYQSGAIVVDGIDVGGSKDKLRDLRRNVGMVFQQFNLFPHLTAAENVMLAPTVVNKVQPGSRELAAEMLAKVGLSDKAANIRASSPADSSSGSRSHARSRCGRTCCCATRSPPRSIRNWSTRCCAWSRIWRRKASR